MEPEDADEVRWRLTGQAGNKLKNTSGWDFNGNGNNNSGFSALPGGSRGDDFFGIFAGRSSLTILGIFSDHS